MCIICAKAKGVKMPSKATIERMWNANPHGAGYMYVKDGKVIIRKGFMKLSDLNASLAKLAKDVDLTETPMVMHWRITTHGGTCPSNTHPFLVTDSIGALKSTSTSGILGVAHNGIIPIKPRTKDISDTMEYIASILAPLKRNDAEFYKNPHMQDLMRNTIAGSRLAYLDADGEITRIGTWYEEDGLWYSNTSYRTPTYGNWSAWDWTENASKNISKGKSKAISCKRKPLMYVDRIDKDAYVCNRKSGYVLDGAEYLVDANGSVYEYDPDMDACILMPDYVAYKRNGNKVKWIAKYAEDEYVLSEN